MEWAFAILTILSLLALIIEIILRMIDKFSADAREGFRRLYIVASVGLILIMLVSGMNKRANIVKGLSSFSEWVLLIPVSALVIALVLNKRGRENNLPGN
jgi:cytochrome bd-type quinol oxidase subunit 2